MEEVEPAAVALLVIADTEVVVTTGADVATMTIRERKVKIISRPPTCADRVEGRRRVSTDNALRYPKLREAAVLVACNDNKNTTRCYGRGKLSPMYS